MSCRNAADGCAGSGSGPTGCTRRCGRWSSGRMSGSSATSGTCWPSTACPTSSGWTAGRAEVVVPPQAHDLVDDAYAGGGPGSGVSPTSDPDGPVARHPPHRIASARGARRPHRGGAGRGGRLLHRQPPDAGRGVRRPDHLRPVTERRARPRFEARGMRYGKFCWPPLRRSRRWPGSSRSSTE